MTNISSGVSTECLGTVTSEEEEDIPGWED